MLRRLWLPERRLLVVPDALTGRVAVESGVADGLALSSPTVQWMASRKQLGRTEMARPFEASDPVLQERSGFGAFAFRKEDLRLLAAWNAAMKTYIGGPEHRALIAEFCFTAAELPDRATRTEVPGK
jgi:polar amino acid transport system substrate-binding protein